MKGQGPLRRISFKTKLGCKDRGTEKGQGGGLIISEQVAYDMDEEKGGRGRVGVDEEVDKVKKRRWLGDV